MYWCSTANYFLRLVIPYCLRESKSIQEYEFYTNVWICKWDLSLGIYFHKVFSKYSLIIIFFRILLRLRTFEKFSISCNINVYTHLNSTFTIKRSLIIITWLRFVIKPLLICLRLVSSLILLNYARLLPNYYNFEQRKFSNCIFFLIASNLYIIIKFPYHLSSSI